MNSNKYKALIRYEFKALKWMMLYFMILFVGYLVLIERVMKNYRLWFLTDTNIFQVNNIMGNTINAKYGWLMLFITIGMLLMVYLQFRDSKNHEVGRFLKLLPVQGTKVYLIKIGCGILSYTVPFVVLVGGIVWIRIIHGGWLEDLYSFTLYSKQFLEVESVGALMGNFGIYYLIGLMVYMVLMMMQYLVSHRVFALVLGLLITVVPCYIANGITGFWGNNIVETIWLPLAYGVCDQGSGYSVEMGEHVSMNWVSTIGLKASTLLIIIVLALWIGYRRSQKLRIEDEGILLPVVWVRYAFVIIGTVCIGLLPMVFRALFWRYPMSLFGMVSVTTLGIIMGYVLSRIIANSGCRDHKEARK